MKIFSELQIKQRLDRWGDLLELLLYSGSITLETHEESVQVMLTWAAEETARRLELEKDPKIGEKNSKKILAKLWQEGTEREQT